MKTAILCCDDSGWRTTGFDFIYSIDLLTALKLKSRGIISQNICDIQVPDLDKSVREQIESGLYAESKRGGAYAWCEIAFQHLSSRFLRYYQYRLRLGSLLKEDCIDSFVITSLSDGDLIHAAKAVCSELRIEISFLHGAREIQSSIHSFLASFDLPTDSPGPIRALEAVFARVLAIAYRLCGKRIFYQDYVNLRQSESHAAKFTWRRSICFPGFGLPRSDIDGDKSLINLNTPIRSTSEVTFFPSAWPGFDRFDLAVLESAFSYFQERYSASHIERIYANCRTFLKQSRVQRLVLNSDNTCTTRLLSKAARAEELTVDYLPHGMVFEDLSLNTGAGCGVDRVLAWNSASAAVFERRGSRTEVISHPSNTILPANKRSLTRKWSDLRVLIMPPEWVGLSFRSRPDCFERDILDVTAALARLDVHSAKIKLHNSIPAVLEAKIKMLDAIRCHAAIDFCLIDSNIPAQKLYEQFDLIVIGPTTGLLEASRSSSPFIAFRAMMDKAGIFSDCSLPAAESIDELIALILNYDSIKVNIECDRMARSLTLGPSPFSAELGPRA